MNGIDVSGLSYGEWRSIRQSYLGGSDVAAALGENPYKSPYMLWLEKTGRFEFDSDNPVTRFGRQWEPKVRDEFAKRTGFKVVQPERMFVHRNYDFLAANVDGIIQPNDKHGSHGILEIKCTLRARIPVLANWEEVPAEYQYQIMHYLSVTGFNYAYLQIYYRDECTYSKPLLVLPDRSMIARTNRLLADWHQKHIEADRPPPLTCEEDLKLKYPTSGDEAAVQATDNIVRKYHGLKQVRERISQLEELQESMELDIKSFMGEAELLKDQERLLASWKGSSRSYFGSKNFRQDYPELYKEYQSETETRIFRLK